MLMLPCPTEDHLIPLAVGGSPRSPKNLWPEKYAGKWGARVKDKLERFLHDRVCDSTIRLSKARKAFRNWKQLSSASASDSHAVRLPGGVARTTPRWVDPALRSGSNWQHTYSREVVMPPERMSDGEEPEVEGHGFRYNGLDQHGNQFEIPEEKILSVKWTDAEGEHEVEGHAIRVHGLSDEPDTEGHGARYTGSATSRSRSSTSTSRAQSTRSRGT
jgi:hypothetical protein